MQDLSFCVLFIHMLQVFLLCRCFLSRLKIRVLRNCGRNERCLRRVYCVVWSPIPRLTVQSNLMVQCALMSCNVPKYFMTRSSYQSPYNVIQLLGRTPYCRGRVVLHNFDLRWPLVNRNSWRMRATRPRVCHFCHIQRELNKFWGYVAVCVQLYCRWFYV
jgi:hypothetical protein